MLWCVQIIKYIMAWWWYLFVCTLHYLIIIIMQLCLKALNLHNACQVYLRVCIFHAIYGAMCIQLTHLSHDDCENTCTLSYYHHQSGSMTHSPLLRVRSWNNGMRCMSFYILLEDRREWRFCYPTGSTYQGIIRVNQFSTFVILISNCIKTC